jgi:hypothetical protein
MKTITLRVAVMAVLLAGFAGWFFARKTNAAPQISVGEPMCSSQIPSSWGEYKGGSQQSGFAFEDSNGTLRFITNVPCDGVPQVALEIRRVKDK